MNKYYTEEEVTYTKRTYNFKAIKAIVDSYLENNLINGERYTCSHVNNNTSYGDDHLEVHLQDCDGFTPDSDFEGDESFEDFCDNLALDIDMRDVDVPFWYYPK